MRFHLLATALLAGAAATAHAQDDGYLQPEIQAQTGWDAPSGLPASTNVADLTARIDALEAQLARLTGLNEENAHRIRELDRAFEQYRRDTEQRVAAAAAADTQAPREEPSTEAPAEERQPAKPEAEEPATGDAAEDAYLVGYRLWEAKKFGEANTALQAMAKKYPRHARASYAWNLAGRALLDDGKPASAAKVLLSNYQTNPKGERAADSLYFLGQSLMELDRAAEACQAYAELEAVYPNMRDWLKQRLPKAKSDADCS